MVNREWVKICFLYTFCVSCLIADPIVQISEGFLRGSVEITRKGRKISKFLGIRYARPPVGNLRFRSPLPVEPWEGIQNATEDGNQCPQFAPYSKKYVGNEDCLFLNVYTPLLEFNSTRVNYSRNGKLLPVMAWIHGGDFVAGNCSTTTFGGTFLLDKDVIYVCMNYRVGILGFLKSDDSAAPGNYGLKDQVLALKWIQRNIPSFGGDPKRVTIFGESAGAVCVHLHVLSKASNGLFQQYIMESGTALFPWGFQPRNLNKTCITQLGMVMFCPTTTTNDIVECLRNKELDNLLYDSYKYENFARYALKTWTPTEEIEAEGAFLAETPENLIAKGKMKDLPFITGTVKDEGLIATLFLHSSYYWYYYIRFVINEFFEFVSKYYLGCKNVDKFKVLIKHYYFNGSFWGSRQNFISDITKFVGDAFFFYPQLKLLAIAENTMKSSFYVYSFEYRGTFSFTSNALRKNSNIGVCHTDELTYLFPSEPRTFGLENSNLNLSSTDEIMIDTMVDLWTSFAINGKPTSKNLQPSDLWESYTRNESYLQIGNMSEPSVTLERNFLKDRMAFWKDNLLTMVKDCL